MVSSTAMITAARHMLDILLGTPYQAMNTRPHATQSNTPSRRQVHVFRLDSGPGDAVSGGRVAEDTFREHVEWQIAEGSNALVPCGTTGESATMSITRSIAQVVAIGVEAAKGRVPVIAGCGSYSTRACIEYIRAAAMRCRRGARGRALLQQPSQAGLVAHFTACEASPIPIIVYNVPSRPSPTSSVEALARAREAPDIVAVKDATGNLGRVSAQRLACGEDFCQLSGNDEMALGFNAMGGVGCISVTANVAPRLCSEFQQAMREGRWDEALRLQDRLYPLHAALFSDAPGADQICADPRTARLPDRTPAAAG